MNTTPTTASPATAAAWIVSGCALLGLTIGFMTGMSVSPTVNALIGLLFAFTGGSVILLIKGRTTDELAIMGKSISVLALGLFIGVLLGVMARVNDWMNFTAPTSNATENSHIPLFRYQDSLTVDRIIELKENKVDSNIIALLIDVETAHSASQISISHSDLLKLSKANIPLQVMQSMLLGKQSSSPSSVASEENKTKLYAEQKPEGEISETLKDVVPNK